MFNEILERYKKLIEEKEQGTANPSHTQMSNHRPMALPKMISSFRFFICFISIIMRSPNQTTIAISRVNYEALLKIGRKNDTFDQIVGQLIKNANPEPLK